MSIIDTDTSTQITTASTARETALRTARTRNHALEEAIFLSFPALKDAARQAVKLESSLSSIGLSPAARAVFVQEAFAPIVQAIFRETTSAALLDSLHEDEEAALMERARRAAFEAFSAARSL
ncbi:hypothetical protein [Frigoribacterium sp. UYMn621]|uniref:hypothetical protein n=1 Tax=Frigoribacterium sp. UYMn621 TaxID=3156343 RepID=UPI00339B4A98